MDNVNFYLALENGFKSAVFSFAGKPCLVSTHFPVLLYADIADQIQCIARALAELNLHKGDRILVQAPKSPMAILLYLACLRSGLVYVPVNPAYTNEEMAYFMGNARPSLLVIDPARLDTLSALGKKQGISLCLTMDAVGAGSFAERVNDADTSTLPCTHCEPDDIAVLIYTSGTTGKPKGAMLSHKNLQANAHTLAAEWGWQHDDVLIHALPIFHVHGLFVALHLALLHGSTMHFLPEFSAQAVLELLPNATVFMGVPTFYTRLLKEPELSSTQCHSMRLFISGSAPLLPATFATFAQRTGHQILERYGMSETGMLVSNPLNGERVSGTVGFALPDVETRICDDSGQAITAGEIGVLEVKGPNVFQGYWEMPQKTTESFHESYFITGDLVQADPDGRLSIVGRSRDLVISGGLNVYPREVEEVINAQPGVLESAVIGVDHPDFGEGLVGIIVPEGKTRPSLKKIQSALKISLSGYKIPKKLLIVEILPRNTMGKVQKSLLQEKYVELFSSEH